LKNDPDLARKCNVEVCISIDTSHSKSKYDNRSFIIDRVALLPRESSDKMARDTKWTKGQSPPGQSEGTDHSKLFVGFCKLPNGKTADSQLWILPIPILHEIVLPPNFDLHRYITHVNRGITHFHASFYPIPRGISDADLEALRFPNEWFRYAFRLNGSIKTSRVVGILNEDGSRTPLYKWARNGHFRVAAPGETDKDGPEEFKKHLVDPSRLVRKIGLAIESLENILGGSISLLEFISGINGAVLEDQATQNERRIPIS
jgi:hypothetical protein